MRSKAGSTLWDPEAQLVGKPASAVEPLTHPQGMLAEGYVVNTNPPMCQVTIQRELVTSPNTPLCLLSSPCQSHCHCLDCSIVNQGHALLYLQEDMLNFRIQYSLVTCCWGYSLPEFPYVVQGIPFKTRTDLSTPLWKTVSPTTGCGVCWKSCSDFESCVLHLDNSNEKTGLSGN